MSRFQQTRQQLRRNRAAAEVTHVPTLGNGPVNGSALVVAEGLVSHGNNSAAIAWGLDGK
jgi:hypothetical protein